MVLWACVFKSDKPSGGQTRNHRTWKLKVESGLWPFRHKLGFVLNCLCRGRILGFAASVNYEVVAPVATLINHKLPSNMWVKSVLARLIETVMGDPITSQKHCVEEREYLIIRTDYPGRQAIHHFLKRSQKNSGAEPLELWQWWCFYREEKSPCCTYLVYHSRRVWPSMETLSASWPLQLNTYSWGIIGAGSVSSTLKEDCTHDHYYFHNLP